MQIYVNLCIKVFFNIYHCIGPNDYIMYRMYFITLNLSLIKKPLDVRSEEPPPTNCMFCNFVTALILPIE